MAIRLEKEVLNLINDAETVKVLATNDENGVPHAVIKQSIHLTEHGSLAYLELLESSRTNKNMLRSLWFHHKIGIALKGKNGESYHITGNPIHAIIAGPVFESYYASIRKRLGDVDLAAVWIIEPEQVIDESFSARKSQEQKVHPIFTHLDRIAK